MVRFGCWLDGSMRWCGMSLLVGVPVLALAGVWRMVQSGPMVFWTVLWRWLRCVHNYYMLIGIAHAVDHRRAPARR